MSSCLGTRSSVSQMFTGGDGGKEKGPGSGRETYRSVDQVGPWTLSFRK